MVDLRAEGNSERDAAKKVSAAHGGSPGPEAIRREYRELKRSGQLPASAPSAERKADQILEHIRFFQAREEDAQRQRALLEKEAEDLGLDLNGQRIGDLLKHLDMERDRLDTLVKSSADWLASYYRQEGITDPEDVKARYLKATTDLKQRERQVDLLRRLRQFRSDPF